MRLTTILILSLLRGVDGPPAGPGPSLRLDEAEWDWGERFTGETVSHVFRIHNDGDEILLLERIQPD